MAQQRGPQFSFYQAPPGPDASRQYSDQVQAILAQGEAVSKPLLMLMQNLAAKQGQQREIAARNAERQDTLDYQRSRDVVKDAQFQQEQGLRQSAENREVAQDQYRKSQDAAALDFAIGQMTPDNMVQKTDPMLDKLVQMRSGMQPVPLSPMPQAAPRSDFIQSFIEQHMRNQERAQEQQNKLDAIQKQASYFKSAIDNHVANGLIPEVDVPMLMAGAGTPGGDARIAKALEDGTKMGLKLQGRKEQLGELDAYAKEHPEDPNVQKWASSLGFLKPMLKNGNGNDELWNDTIKAVRGGMYGTAKGGTTKPPTMQIGDSKFDVPPYVAAGGVGQGGLPPDVENYVRDTAFALANKDKRLEGVSGAGMPPEERAKIIEEKTQQVRDRLKDQFGWKVDPLPYGEGTPLVPQSEAAPSPAPAAPPQTRQDPTAGLPDEVLKAMHDAKAGGPEAVKAVLKNAIEADRKKSSLPENAGAVGSEFLKKDPEPKWWWSMNSGYAPMLKPYGGSVEKAHAAWQERWKKEFGR